MKPDKLTIHDLFQRERRYVVPLYQRAYVWTRQLQWEPLWEDIERQAEACFNAPNHTPTRSHFLGAIVLNVSRIVGSGVARSEVIDGQQRLTTLQLFIAALRDYAVSIDSAYAARLRRLTVNEDEKPSSEGAFKVWPTNADRAVFRQVVGAGSIEEVERAYGPKDVQPRMKQAYGYFLDQVRAFAENQGAVSARDDRVFALLQALRTALQVVVIELEDGDDPQVIFETLNARGQPLLPSDLIRNYLFMRANYDGELDVDELYDSYWRPFDDRRTEVAVGGEDRFWHIEERQGRLTRPRIDLFLFHYLVMQTESDFTIGSLFREFRDWRDRTPDSIETLLADLRRYSEVFSGLIAPTGTDRPAVLARRLQAMDTSTVYPFLMYVLAQPTERLSATDRDRLLVNLESWLVRRFVCQLTNKNYNRFFVSLLTKVKRASAGDNLADVVRDELARAHDVTTAWPTDWAFRSAWLTKPVYSKSRPDRAAMLLRAIEAKLRTRRNEAVTLPPTLSVEHLMPQRGSRSDYPLATDELAIGDETPDQCRERLLHTVGNLTLLTCELNASASNGPFPAKVEKIVADSDLRLNAWLRTDPPGAWLDDAIVARGERLFAQAIEIWPRSPNDTGIVEDGDVEAAPSTATINSGWQFTDRVVLATKRKSLLEAMSIELGTPLIADTVGKHRSADGSQRVAVAISKRYDGRADYPYWYGYHPDWQEYLVAAINGHLLLGMVDRDEGYALPFSVLTPLLPLLNTTTRPDTGRLHWHMHVVEQTDGLALLLHKSGKKFSITPYIIQPSKNRSSKTRP
ncbi:DUF262 domain-containing protein [Sphingomonas sp. CFBP9019]|uniref:DUF262 domain-containing protein n=1 Tax=Sphingomonas sp. CFBP9019 TaxID=3096532 RepID=UPI002A6B6842|nr:DUF262 domain-containing protein [Sphingomonas sp. CFBP9019]MDY1010335.1 DUF262 domain-containing protein [Sphingomonas sp. CFBP9019]